MLHVWPWGGSPVWRRSAGNVAWRMPAHYGVRRGHNTVPGTFVDEVKPIMLLIVIFALSTHIPGLRTLKVWRGICGRDGNGMVLQGVSAEVSSAGILQVRRCPQHISSKYCQYSQYPQYTNPNKQEETKYAQLVSRKCLKVRLRYREHLREKLPKYA